MDKAKIDISDYTNYGLEDLYYELITFVSKYANQNYDPLEILQNDSSKYAFAISTMKAGIKELLDYLKTVEEIYFPKLNRTVRLNSLTIEEQSALAERCKEYLVSIVEYALKEHYGVENSSKTR